MKLKAVRVAEVGLFRSGVAVENFSGQFNVLCAPNEAGKSTLLRALSAVFAEAHTGLAREVKDLAPSGGGAPLIEVDFEAEGRSWRLRKRYLAQKMAELTDTGTGHTLRAADAENRLKELLRTRLGGGSLLDLLWVKQNSSLLPILDKDAGATLRSAVDAQLAQAVGFGPLRSVREQVNARIEGLLTKSTRVAKANSDYARAIAEQQRLQAEFGTAQAQALQRVERLDELAALRAEETKLADASAVAAREKRVDDTAKALAAGQDAARQLKAAAEAVAAARTERDRAQRDVAAFEEKLKSLQAITDRIAVHRSRIATLSGDRETAAAEVRRLEDSLERRAADVAAVQSALASAEAAMRRNEIARRRGELTQRLSEASAARKAIAALDATIGAIKLSEATLQRLRALSGDLAIVESELAAAVPRVRFDIEPAAIARVRVGGGEIAADAEMGAAEPLLIEIEGIGRITISPGGSRSLADARVRRDSLAGELSAMFAASGVSTLPEAEASWKRRAVAERDRSDAQARLNAAAPQGIAGIEAELAGLEPDAMGTGDGSGTDIGQNSELPDLPSLRNELTNAVAIEKQELRRHADAKSAYDKYDREIATLAGGLDRDEDHARAADSALPPVAERARHRDNLAVHVSACEAKWNAAIRAETAWREASPDADGMSALDRAARDARSAAEAARQRLAQLREDAATIEGALRAGETGGSPSLEDIKARLDAATDRVERFNRDSKALMLLERLLAEREAAEADAVHKPVRERMKLYADLIFPGVDVTVGDGFTIGEVHRGGRAEVLERLSIGTVEQLGVVARLAYARLLAEEGTSVPLILDDPFVYADDGRLDALFSALAAAGALHQVVVLSCHEAAFRPLSQTYGAAALELVPWRPG